jgi:hypothetical protein
MEAVCFSETSVSTYKSRWPHYPEDELRHLPCGENLKYHKGNTPNEMYVSGHVPPPFLILLDFEALDKFVV